MPANISRFPRRDLAATPGLPNERSPLPTRTSPKLPKVRKARVEVRQEVRPVDRVETRVLQVNGRETADMC